jgi:hypothetical protein
MANNGGGLHIGWLIVLFAMIAVGVVQCGGGAGAADMWSDPGVPLADAVAAGLAGQNGERVTAVGVLVVSVPADEGFWVQVGSEQVWVQLQTAGTESPYTVRPGQTVSFTGTVVAHGPAYPVTVGANEPVDADRLVAQGAHVAVDMNSMEFGVG